VVRGLIEGLKTQSLVAPQEEGGGESI